MELYAAYIKEREDFETLQHPYGFATYQIPKCPLVEGEKTFKMIYLKDIYVVPSHRRTQVATEIADRVSEIGIADGCERLVGSVCLSDPHVTENFKTILSYGFSFLRMQGNLLFFVKEL